MTSVTLLITVEDELLTRLDALVLATGHDRQHHIQRALEQYLAKAMDELQAIDEGIADAEAGRLTDLETVRAQWRASEM